MLSTEDSFSWVVLSLSLILSVADVIYIGHPVLSTEDSFSWVVLTFELGVSVSDYVILIRAPSVIY